MRLPTDLKKWARPRKDMPIVVELLDDGRYKMDPYEPGDTGAILTESELDDMVSGLNIAEGMPGCIVID